MGRQYPNERFIRETLDEAEHRIARATGSFYGLSVDKERNVLAVVRNDGWHAAYEVRHPEALKHVRQEPICCVFPVTDEALDKRLFKEQAAEVIEQVILGHQAEQAGVAPEDMWRNSPGELVETLPGGVTVRWMDIVNSECTPSKYSFYEDERLVFHASKNLLGDNPSDVVLQAVWNAYRDGLSDGILQGAAEGRRDLQRDIAELLREAA